VDNSRSVREVHLLNAYELQNRVYGFVIQSIPIAVYEVDVVTWKRVRIKG
jgi:hypothetical protein